MSSELLSEILKKLTRVESMPCFIIERNIEEEEPLPDKVEAMGSGDELVGLDEVKRKLVGND